MSTVSDYVTKTELSPAALNGMVIPFVSILFFGGIPGLPKLMPMVWATLFPTTMPGYLTEAGAVFSWSAIATGLMRYFLSQHFAEELRVEGEVKTLGTEDLPIFIFYLGWWLVVVWYLNLPMSIVTFLQGGFMVGLLMSFYSVPWYLTRYFAIPSETDDLAVKTWVFFLTILIAGGFTLVAVLGMRTVEFCAIWSSQCPLP